MTQMRKLIAGLLAALLLASSPALAVDAVTSQTLYDDGGHVVIHLTNVSDGTGESAVTKVDASALVGGAATTRYAVEAIAWATVGMGFNLLWDADTDVLFFTTGNSTSQGFIDYVN